MFIGIVADIHDALEPLSQALFFFREKGVKRIVTLGDAFDSCMPGDPGPEIASLLLDAGAIGVWGNHDFGLSHDVPEELRDRADPTLLGFASRLQPQLVVEGCRFSHVEPWKDAFRLEDLWSFEDMPASGDNARRSFEAVPERILFAGHYHSPLVFRSEGRVEWDGVRPIRLDPPHRHLVFVPAVRDGWCVLFETIQSELTAIRCGRHDNEKHGALISL